MQHATKINKLSFSGSTHSATTRKLYAFISNKRKENLNVSGSLMNVQSGFEAGVSRSVGHY